MISFRAATKGSSSSTWSFFGGCGTLKTAGFGDMTEPDARGVTTWPEGELSMGVVRFFFPLPTFSVISPGEEDHRQREKIDWQELCKFDCRLVRTIFIFCCPSPFFDS